MASRKGATRNSEKLSSADRQAQLEEDIRRYLNGGGNIKVVPSGTSGESGWKRDIGEVRPNTRVNIQSPIAYGFL